MFCSIHIFHTTNDLFWLDWIDNNTVIQFKDAKPEWEDNPFTAEVNFGLCEHRLSCHKYGLRLAYAYSCVTHPTLAHLVPQCISPLSAEGLGNTAAATTAVGAQRDLRCLMLLNCGGPGGVWEVTLTSLTNVSH